MGHLQFGESSPPDAVHTTTLRFYAELNDFLPRERRQVTFTHHFHGRVTVKDMIESLGVPHTEVDMILVNGQPVDFNQIVQAGSRISVYPVFESIDISPLIRLRPTPLQEPSFVLDAHLGRLARYLRLLGFDATYRNDFEDSELANISSRENRILLTRDRGLLKRRQVIHGYCVRDTDARNQIVEVIRRFDLADRTHPFSRCARCNGLLEQVSKEEVHDQLEPMTRHYYTQFSRCSNCGQIYWPGSQFARIQRFVEEVLARARSSYDGRRAGWDRPDAEGDSRDGS